MVTWKKFSPEKAAQAQTAVVEVYRAAFKGAPYFEPESQVRRFQADWAAYTAKPGFRFTAALADYGAMVGFACGWDGIPNEAKWVPQVREALGAEADSWMTDFFLLGEIAVTPLFRGQGLGQILLDALLRPETKRPVLLLTLDLDSPAMALYRKNGFQRLAAHVTTLPSGPLSAFGKLARIPLPR